LETAKIFEGAEEQLLFFPFFLSSCVEFIPKEFVAEMLDLILSLYVNDPNRQ